MNPHLSTFLSQLSSDTLVVIPGNSLVIRSEDVHYPFRQDSDFLYLTGLSVPSLQLTLYGSEVILWRDPISEKDILWGHNKLTDDVMRTLSGIEDIRDKSEFEEYKIQKSIYLSSRGTRDLFQNHGGEKNNISLISEGKSDSSLSQKQTERNDKNETIEQDQWKEIIHSLRLIKTPDEIEKIQKAIRVSRGAFAHIEKIIQPGMYEYEIEAEIARIFRHYHLTEAYPTIVASGPNTCILHYTEHSRQIKEGDLVLIDAGCEYMGYASDTTRTIYVGENMPERVQRVYDAVLSIKKIAEHALVPNRSLTEYENIVRSAMNLELQKLGLIPDHSTEEETSLLSKKYYPHRTSHFLGLDVHDVGSRDAVLVPGMVLTIEPGIYIREENIGIRIEDDYLITDSDSEKLI